MAAKPNPNLMLVRHNNGRVDRPRDPAFPIILEATFGQTEFMGVTAAFLYGPTEVIEVAGKTIDDITEFVRINDFARHPRLRRLVITQGAETLFEVSPREKKPAPPVLIP